MVKNRVRNRQRVSRGTAVLGTVPPAPIPATERRRATPRVVHPGDPRRPSAALIVTRTLEASSFLVPLPRAASGLSNPSSSRAAPAVVHRPAVVPRASILLNPFHLALHLLRLIPCLVEWVPDRIGLAPSSRPRPPLSTSVKLRSELRPSRRRPPSGLPSRKTNPR